MQSVPATYQKRYLLSDATCDFRRTVKLSELLSMFQDVAVVHATQLNTGFEAMRERGFFWVLSRVNFNILRAPSVDEELVVTTFPEPPNPLHCCRVYTVETPAGERLVNGYSLWCVLDSARGRLTPIRNIGLADPVCYAQKDFELTLNKILCKESGQPVYRRTVRVADLDANIHMNNARYMDVVLDAFSYAELAERPIRGAQINFLAQSREGDEIVVYRSNLAEDEVLVEGKIGGAAPCFAAVVRF